MVRRVLCTTFVAFTAVAFVAGCSSKDKAADTVKTDTAAAVTTPPPPPPAPALTDANIAAILDNANMADSAAGNVAVSKGTSSDVKTFGKNMMNDHHALRKAGQDLVKKLGVTPAMPAGDTTAAAAQKWNENLASMTKGADFDKAYIDHEVAYHQEVLNTAQAALGAAQNQELKDLITKAAPNIQAHLEHAKSIQAKLSGSAAPAGGDTAKKKP